MNTLPEWIKLSCEKIEPVGSRVTCNPPPMDTDQDWLCLLYPTMDMEDFTCVLEDNEYEVGGSLVSKSKWRSFKNGENNLLITKDPEYFSLFMAATEEAKRLNLMLKRERIALFQKMVPQKKEFDYKSFFGNHLLDLEHPTTNFVNNSTVPGTHVQWPSVVASQNAQWAEEQWLQGIQDSLFVDVPQAPTGPVHAPGGVVFTTGWGVSQPPAPPVVAPSTLLTGLLGQYQAFL